MFCRGKLISIMLSLCSSGFLYAEGCGEKNNECMHDFERLCLAVERSSENAELRETIDTLYYISNANSCADAAKVLRKRDMIELRNPQLRDLRPLVAFYDLKILNLYGTSVDDNSLSALSDLHKLESIGLSNTLVKKGSSIRDLIQTHPQLKNIWFVGGFSSENLREIMELTAHNPQVRVHL